MVCIAAFIILAIVGLFVAVISIFKRDIGTAYWKAFKKAWGCVGKKIRLQKCETNFKDDVKNSLLKKIVLKKPHLVKPLSITIEIASVVVVLVVVWAMLTSIKSLLALWTFGTCNVTSPSSCALGATACSIDEEEPKNIFEATGRWFTEWGEIFVAIPDALHSWDAKSYRVEPDTIVGDEQGNLPYALDIIDPGCSVCMQSYRSQKESGFFERYNTILMFYPIELPDGGYKFSNSGIITRYLHASNILQTNYAERIIDRIFTEKNADGYVYQNVFNNELTESEAELLLKDWLSDFGADETQLIQLSDLAHSEQVDNLMQQIKHMVEDTIHVKGIPTLIYNGRKHNGKFES